jgi:hypothetical protein
MIEVEIIREYKCCWQVGQRREVSDEFAAVLIDGGFARRVERGEFDRRGIMSPTPVSDTRKA